jgi:hypothetical protein
LESVIINYLNNRLKYKTNFLKNKTGGSLVGQSVLGVSLSIVVHAKFPAHSSLFVKKFFKSHYSFNVPAIEECS